MEILHEQDWLDFLKKCKIEKSIYEPCEDLSEIWIEYENDKCNNWISNVECKILDRTEEQAWIGYHISLCWAITAQNNKIIIRIF